MTPDELDCWITLRFWPPQATEQYADSIPEPIRARFLQLSNLSPEKFNTQQAFIYLTGLFYRSYPTAYWKLLRQELTDYYRDHHE